MTVVINDRIEGEQPLDASGPDGATILLKGCSATPRQDPRDYGAVRARRPALGAALLAGVVVTAVLAISNNSATEHSSAVSPVRVTSGTEIATGFSVGPDRVVTVAHVLGAEVEVGGTPARVVRIDRRADLALLRVPGVTAAAPEEARAGAGNEVRVVRLRGARSNALSAHVRRPIVAHVRTLGAGQAVTRPALELAGHVVAGDSGAPVVSRSGALVGVIFAASSGREDTAYAVDAGAVGRLLAIDERQR
jgi:S1-C subfamily serine protease